MSAICGIVSESAAGGRGRRDVSLMLDLLVARGPDGAIVHEEPGTSRPVVLGARRLAVAGTSGMSEQLGNMADAGKDAGGES